jgi:heat shock protein HslJ
MDQEAKFFAALDATRRWEVAPDAGLLRLYDASGAEVVRLSRLGSSAG